MGALIDFLRQENVQLRPAMTIGSGRLSDVVWWIVGAECALHWTLPHAPDELDGFREWLVLRFDGPSNVHWPGIVLWKFGDDENGTAKLFDCLNEFLRDLAERGLGSILSEHREYEIRRYGSPITARRK